MNLIAAVDANWGIGYKNKLLVSIPDDMKFFRETTTGKVVVMGRKTLESFPNGLSKREAVKEPGQYCVDKGSAVSGGGSHRSP